MSNVVITGASKGIGFGLAEEFLRQGHSVTIGARNQQGVDDAVGKLNSIKQNSAVCGGTSCDVASKEQVQALWSEAVSTMGSVDIWINNAGLARTTWSIADVPQSEIEAMVTTNMLGTINGCRTAIAGMQQQGGSGKIFNILGGGSDGEYFPGMGIYGTTKRGLDYFTNALVKETKDTALLIGKIRPGMIITEAVVREAQEDPEGFAASRKMMNNLVDRIETVAPFLVEEMMKFDKSGEKIAWLNGGKIGWRMMKSRFKERPDQFEAFGL